MVYHTPMQILTKAEINLKKINGWMPETLSGQRGEFTGPHFDTEGVGVFSLKDISGSVVMPFNETKKWNGD